MKEFKANNGCFLTQTANVSKEERMFILAIKGVNLNESDWKEITLEEKIQLEQIEEEQL